MNIPKTSGKKKIEITRTNNKNILVNSFQDGCIRKKKKQFQNVYSLNDISNF